MKIETNEIREGQEITSITPNDDGLPIFNVVRKDKFYETNYARIKPFLMAYGRVKIAKVMLPILDNIVRCHTDGLISKTELQNLKRMPDLGDLKFEGKIQCEIINSIDFNCKEIDN